MLLMILLLLLYFPAMGYLKNILWWEMNMPPGIGGAGGDSFGLEILVGFSYLLFYQLFYKSPIPPPVNVEITSDTPKYQQIPDRISQNISTLFVC